MSLDEAIEITSFERNSSVYQPTSPLSSSLRSSSLPVWYFPATYPPAYYSLSSSLPVYQSTICQISLVVLALAIHYPQSRNANTPGNMMCEELQPSCFYMFN